MRRGDIVTVSVRGDYGKPRPAVVVQSDRLDGSDSVLVCLLTSTMRAAPLHRLSLEPGAETGLRQKSQVMVDKIFAIRRDKCGPPIGRIGCEALIGLDHVLALVLGLAETQPAPGGNPP